jgi:hypothetical protein
MTSEVKRATIHDLFSLSSLDDLITFGINM